MGSQEHVPAITLRASLTDEEWKALLSAATRTGSNVQTIVGSLILDYLWTNGYLQTEETDGSADGVVRWQSS